MAIFTARDGESCVEDMAAVAARLGLEPGEWESYGANVAKLKLNVLERAAARRRGRYIVVTTTTPTRSGEGKTVVSIGLVQALRRMGYQATATLRQPALAPVLGSVGGATGGGKAHLVGAERINLHFTGDQHAAASAHNLLMALLDNHIHQGNTLDVDPDRVFWRRVLDLNDRSLRSIRTCVEASDEGRPTGFDVLGVSEVMSILALSTDPAELRLRLGEIAPCLDRKGRLIHARQLNAHDMMSRLLADALRPNLVQSGDGSPILVHTCAYADHAVGGSSIVADRIALGLADYVITEAGMGADCGVEKLVHIKCAAADLQPALAVLVTTIKALKVHGGLDATGHRDHNLRALQAGCCNLAHHMGVLRTLGLPVVVALNRFPEDTDEECQVVLDEAEKEGAVDSVEVDVFRQGSEGGMALAGLVEKASRGEPDLRLCYQPQQSILEKVESVGRQIYGAGEIELAEPARRMLRLIEDHGLSHLPICIAKTPLSLSHLPAVHGAPRGFTLPITDMRIAAGGRYIVVETPHTRHMPGLPAAPAWQGSGVST